MNSASAEQDAAAAEQGVGADAAAAEQGAGAGAAAAAAAERAAGWKKKLPRLPSGSCN